VRAAVLRPAAPSPRLSPWWLGVAAAGSVGIALLFFLIAYPSLVLLASALGRDGRPTAQFLLTVLRDREVYRTLGNSLLVSLVSALAGTALGGGLAWLVACTDLPGRRLWQVLLLIPYMIPPFIGAMAWVYLLGPVGWLNQLWMAVTGSDRPLLVIYGAGGTTFALTVYGYPIAYLAILGVLERMDPSLLEAARMSGAGLWRTWRDIALPLARPGVLAGALLLFASSLANFGVPAVLGFPARFFVLPTRIYATVLNYDLRDNLRIAAAMSLWLVALAGCLIAVEGRLVVRERVAVITGRLSGATVVPLGRWRWPVIVSLALFVGIAVVFPVAAILLTSLVRAYGLPPAPENLTLQHYATALFGIPKVHRAIRNSLLLAAGAAGGVVLAGLVLAYLIRRGRWGGLVRLSATIPYAVPGTVVALSMILAYLRPLPLVGIRLYDTIWILLVAYLSRFLLLGLRTAEAALAQVHPSLEEAARISGARPLTAFRDVVVPLIRSSLIGGWFLVFIPAVAELTLSALLASAGNETIGVVVFGLHEEGKVALAAALACVVTFIVIGIHTLALLRGGRWVIWRS
jgi:iron(III) transport system permease protein